MQVAPTINERGKLVRCWWTLVQVMDYGGMGQSVVEIVRLTGLGRRRVYRWLKAGVQAGAVVEHQAWPKTYTLAPRHRT